MKRIYLLSLIALSALLLTSELLSNQINAQQASGASRVELTKATPTPTPTPKAAPTINEEDEIIKVDTELVNLNVRVIDRNNRPVANLKPSDFKVYEDNVLQKIESFNTSEVPTNYSLVLDNSGSLRSQIDQVIEAGKILVRANKPEDETSIIRFVSSDKIETLEDFTKNKADLIDALDTKVYIEGGQTAITDAVYLAAQNVTKYEQSSSTEDRKRRALILVSDGEDRSSFYTQQQLFDLLKESEVQIYVVGFVKDLSSEKTFISKSPQGKAKAFLERLAADTGGKSYFPNDVSELPGIAREIASELRTQYSITYYPTNELKDGTFRRIKVTVEDGPNKQTRLALTRAGRTAAKEGGNAAAKKPN